MEALAVSVEPEANMAKFSMLIFVRPGNGVHECWLHYSGQLFCMFIYFIIF